MFDRLPLKAQNGLIDKDVTRAITADGTIMKFLGQVEVPLTIRRAFINTTVLVSEGLSQEVILGCDFMEANKVVLNFEDRTVTIPPVGSLPLGNKVQVNRTKRIFTSEPINVPKRSKVLFFAEVEDATGLGQEESGVIEPDQHFMGKMKMLGCNLLASTSSALVPVLYINPLEDDRVIAPNTTVGRFSPLSKASPIVYLPMSADEDDDILLASASGRTDFMKDIDLDSSHVDDAQKEQLRQLLLEYGDIFATSMKDINVTSVVKHRIDTGDAKPVQSKPYRVSPEKQEHSF